MGRAYEVRKASIQKTGAAKAKLYSMYAREIYQAAKTGGVETESNMALKRLVERAKKEQVPADIIKRAIDKVNSGADESYTSTSYEIFGPGGATLIVECLTDNVNRSVSNIRAVINKCHVKLGAMGSVSYMYDNLCIVGFKGLDEEQVMDAMIDADVDVSDIELDDDMVVVYGNPKDLYDIKTAITKVLPNVEFDVDEIAMLPKEKITLTGEDGRIVDGSTVITSITIKNVRTVTNIHKTDITGTNEIEGAHLQVKDSFGNVVDDWISESDPHPIPGLGAGLTYTLVETIAPRGYALTSAREFTVNADGTVTEVDLRNDIITLTISKQDITNSKELPGAKLVLKDSEGNVYEEWTSGENEHVIEMIPAGTYTLEETTSPDGYMLNTETITFVVDKYGKVTVDGNEVDKVIMYNTPETPVPKTAANISVFVYLIGIIAVSGGAYLLYNKKKLNK